MKTKESYMEKSRKPRKKWLVCLDYVLLPASSFFAISDIATFPWIARHEWHDIGLSKFKNLTRRYCEISKRDAVIKGFSFIRV